MSSRRMIFIGVLVVGLLAAVGAFLFWPEPARTVTISVSATPGTKITGNYEVDGVKSQIDSVAPTQFVVTGRKVTCRIQKDDQPGEMSVKIATEGGSASAPAGPGEGVNVGFHHHGTRLTMSETFWANTSQAVP